MLRPRTRFTASVYLLEGQAGVWGEGRVVMVVSAPTDAPVRVGDEVELTVGSLAHGGEAVGRVRALVCFVAGAAPGEQVRVRVTEARKRFARATVVRVLDASPDRVEPPCPYFGACGGCQWQYLAYPAQLAAKHGILRDQLRRALCLPDDALDALVRPPIGMRDPWGYRNSVGVVADADGKPSFRHLHSHATVAIDHCPISQPGINRALAALSAEGVAGALTIRTDADGAAVVLVSGERVQTRQTLLGASFRTDGAAFFQVNTRREARLDLAPPLPGEWRPEENGVSMADILAATALRGLALTGRETVLDAYAGVGTFALLAAPRARRVIAVEEVAVAATDARANARALGIENVTVHARKVERFLPALAERGERIDAVILDPPRSGCVPEVLAALMALAPARIVYVSCDPATLARDLAVLAARYDLEAVQPIDMFPQTFHIESVTTLTRKKGAA